jgi:prolyl oligopeptidase
MLLKLAGTLVAALTLAVGTYPVAPRAATVDTYFGNRVADPYRPLERLHAAETRRWVAQETALTERVFREQIPERAAMRALVARVMTAPHDDLPQRGGGVRAFTRSDGSLHQPVIVAVRNGRERIVIDPNAMWRDGRTTLANWVLAPDGRSVAYSLATAGNGLVRWRVRELATGRDTRDDLRGVPDWAEDVSWTHDGRGFYYGGYTTGTYPSAGVPIGTHYAVRLHRLGTAQRADRVVFARPDHPAWLPYAQESDDGTQLVAGAIVGGGGGNLVAIRAVARTGAPLRVIRPLGNANYFYIGSQGSTLFFRTNDGAPHWKLVAIDVRHPARDRDVIPERRETLDDVAAAGDTFVARYLHDVRSELIAFTRGGARIGPIALPGPGSVTAFAAGTQMRVGYYAFSSPTMPPATFAFDASTKRVREVARDRAPFDIAGYVTEELFARSPDGTRVPVFVAHRRDAPRDGSVPTMLTGYGAFGDSYYPTWSPLGAAWLAKGGTFAIACIRGGGEYGEAWHRAGMRGNKQHAFDDFAAAARMLIAEGYAAHATLAAYGYSGGGLLAGATEVQQPGLFGGVVEAAGPVDVLRGHTYGTESSWVGEVGSPTASAAQFRWLYAYAPLAHMRRGTHYPPTLVTTSDNDARVSPAHAYKFAATMQAAQGGDAPVLLYVAPNAGHLGGGSVQADAARMGDAEAFLRAAVARDDQLFM